jgi:4-carboxymuconolactone decarboxylase
MEGTDMPRIPPLEPGTLDPEQRRVHDAIVAGPRGRVEGPLRVWLESPALADRAQALGAFCRFQSSLPPRLSELAILVTGAFWRSGFEWHVHAPIGIAAGLDAATVETIRVGGAPVFARDDERAVHAFAHELLTTKRVGAATYASAKAILGQRALVDLVGIIGYYGLISLTINAFEVAVPAPHPDPFAT